MFRDGKSHVRFNRYVRNEQVTSYTNGSALECLRRSTMPNGFCLKTIDTAMHLRQLVRMARNRRINHPHPLTYLHEALGYTRLVSNPLGRKLPRLNYVWNLELRPAGEQWFRADSSEGRNR